MGKLMVLLIQLFWLPSWMLGVLGKILGNIEESYLVAKIWNLNLKKGALEVEVKSLTLLWVLLYLFFKKRKKQKFCPFSPKSNPPPHPPPSITTLSLSFVSLSRGSSAASSIRHATSQPPASLLRHLQLVTTVSPFSPSHFVDLSLPVTLFLFNSLLSPSSLCPPPLVIGYVVKSKISYCFGLFLTDTCFTQHVLGLKTF